MTRDDLVEVLSTCGQGVGSLTPVQVLWIMTMVDEYTAEQVHSALETTEVDMY